MKIDLHIHSKDCSDGKMTLPEIFEAAHRRHIDVISITDHDSIDCQESAEALSQKFGMHYIPGVELNISFSCPPYNNSRPVSLDVLGYGYDIQNDGLAHKLWELREYRTKRAQRILENINQELAKEHLEPFTSDDMEAIAETVDGSFGRPHIADYMVKKGIVSSRKEAFERYLVKCNVPKMPVSLEDASCLIRQAGGKLMLAHPNNPSGTSLVSLTSSLTRQHHIIKEAMLPHLDGIECWHSSHDRKTASVYLDFARQEGLMVTGGSDCHQQPLILGTVDVPVYVADQFGL
ncbi:MAG: PHP domain-containing protein [Thermodesulfobacteriota bacterium]|nr:PHP domain-containing protein [Thermodesulfobacteriota bacterium]